MGVFINSVYENDDKVYEKILNTFKKNGIDMFFYIGDVYKRQGKVRVGSDYYFFDSDGTMKTGFRAEDGEIYYFSPENGKMLMVFIPAR